MKRTPLRRKIRIKLRNPARLARLRAEQFGPQAALARRMPCCACQAAPPSDPHHVTSRGAGGTDRDVIALCRNCHRRFHSEGPAFWLRMRVNPLVVLATMRILVLDTSTDEGLPVSVMLGRSSS